MPYLITTTIKPEDEITVPDAEYRDLYAQGLINTAVYTDTGETAPGSLYARTLTPTSTQTGAFTLARWTTALCDASAGDFTATLPTGAPGEMIRIINMGAAGTVTVAPPVGYESGGSIALSEQYEILTVQCVSTGTWIGVGP